MKYCMTIAICAFMALGGIHRSTTVRAQEDFPSEPPRRVKMFERKVVGNSSWPVRNEFAGRPESMHEIGQAAAKIRDAEGDDAKAAAKKELATLLDKYFEDDMKRRADELAKIEERVKKLHALMEKRVSKKQEIIDLQMKVLEYDADGLGLFNNAQPNDSGAFFFKEGRAPMMDKGPHAIYREMTVPPLPPPAVYAPGAPAVAPAPPVPPRAAEPVLDPR